MKPTHTAPGSVKHLLYSLAVIVLLSCCTSSCLMAQREGAARVPKMSRESVFASAKKAAERAGYALGDYRQPEAYFELAAPDRTWTVFFEEITPARRGDFQVWIDDNTGGAEVMTGD